MNQREGPRARLLVVDDEEAVLFTLTRFLTPLGYEVTCAREREEAEALLAGGRFDLVISDLHLTGLHAVEGLELVRFVKGGLPDTRIVLLTAYGTKAIEDEARRLGVDGLFDKSEPLPAMAETVAALLAARR